MLVLINGDNLWNTKTSLQWHLSPDNDNTRGSIKPVEPDLLDTWGLSHLGKMKVRGSLHCNVHALLL